MNPEIIEALMHAEFLAQDALSQEEVHARAWSIVYLLQRARNPDFAPENYTDVVREGRAYNVAQNGDDSGLQRSAH